MKRLVIVLLVVFFVFVAFGSCKQNSGSTDTSTKTTASNKAAANNASQVTKATEDLNKTINDLKLDDDTASVNNQDYASNFQSTIDDFQNVLSSDADTVNVN